MPKPNHIHESHPNIVKRLNRALGHLKSTINMFEAKRSCLDIAQQLSAVEKAIIQAKKTLIKDHIDHCLENSGSKQRDHSSISDLKEITKYL